jgi:hypothetical protein
MRRDVRADPRPARDLALYERLIDDGVAAAYSQGGVIDHVTARRMAIWLISRQQPSDFARGLIRFARSGAITTALKTQLRNYARSAGYPHRPQAARLMEYVVGRDTDLGPVSTDFGGICDQIDHADAMLTGLRDRIRDGRGLARASLVRNRRPAACRHGPPRSEQPHGQPHPCPRHGGPATRGQLGFRR